MARKRVQMVGVLLAPCAPLAVGVIVMRGGNVPASIWFLNMAAAAVGVALAGFALVRTGLATSFRESLRWAVLVGVVLLGATLLADGMDGVHRWLPVGPVQIHAGALLLPPLLVTLLETSWITAVGGAFAALVVLLLQPDAAQAASFCVAWISIAVVRRGRKATTVIVGSMLLAAACMLRPDPLEPVLHVEGIVGMAATQGSSLAVAALVSLVVPPLALAFLLGRRVGLVLAIYSAVQLIAAWFGNYPVPVLGYGVSPILGYYGGVAMAVRLGQFRREPPGLAPAAV